MSRYRKISTRLWGDEGFRSLSPMLPSGQSLWTFLLAYPGFTAIPGLIRDRREGMAALLGWSLPDFDRCWRELDSSAMADASPDVLASGECFGVGEDRPMALADWRAGVVWMPNAVAHNRPESFNVVASWSQFIDQIPECLLKARAVIQTHDSLSEWNPEFAEVYREYFYDAITEATTYVAKRTSPDDMPHVFAQGDRLATVMASGAYKLTPSRRHPRRHKATKNVLLHKAYRMPYRRSTGSPTPTPTPAPAPAPTPTPTPRNMHPHSTDAAVGDANRDAGDHEREHVLGQEPDDHTPAPPHGSEVPGGKGAATSGEPMGMPVIPDADAACLAWAETGLWAAQREADGKADAHVVRTLTSLVRDFGDAKVAAWSRDYARWWENNPGRTKGRKRHDSALDRWIRKAQERALARGDDLRVAGPAPAADPDAIRKLEQEFGR